MVAGDFSGSIDLGGGLLTAATGPNNATAIFLGVVDASGGHRFSARFGNGENQGHPILAIGADDPIWLVGSYEGAVDFGAGTLASQGLNDIYVARFQ